MSEGRVQSGEDYYYAAFIFQHGQKPSDYLYAHVLAVTAVNKGFKSAIWLCAATLDRYLCSIKQPQVFGTQIGSLDDGPTTQEPYDKEMVSDTRGQCGAWHHIQRRPKSSVMSGLAKIFALRAHALFPESGETMTIESLRSEETNS